jgi:hypothetical protein
LVGWKIGRLADCRTVVRWTIHDWTNALPIYPQTSENTPTILQSANLAIFGGSYLA